MCYKRQQGFSLPVAIFILVIMALVAVAAVSIMETGQAGISNDVMSTRAFYAAESGAQHVLHQLFPLDGSAANCQANYPDQNFNITGLGNCLASAQCNTRIVGTKIYYIVTSTGVCSSGDISATRQIEMMAAAP